MRDITNQTFVGERACFASYNVRFIDCVFEDGESPIKESNDVEVLRCSFRYKYPMWYSKGLLVQECQFTPTERAGIWYSQHIRFDNCLFDGPKNFRKCNDVDVKDSIFSNALETFWWNEDLHVSNCRFANSPYLFSGSKRITLKNCFIEGDYVFDGCEDVEIENCVFHSKDAFWNCKRATIKDSIILGQYIGWNSEDVTLINCHVESNQGFCYMKRIKLVKCELEKTDLSFEYCSEIDAEVTTVIDSVKNPLSGIIKAKGIQKLIMDKNAGIDPQKTAIVLQ